MLSKDTLTKTNRSLARRRWRGQLRDRRLETLVSLSKQYGFSIALGDLLFVEGKWHVTHAGLLRLAQRTHCAGICVQQVREFCDVAARRWVFKAAVFKSSRSRGFVGSCGILAMTQTCLDVTKWMKRLSSA